MLLDGKVAIRPHQGEPAPAERRVTRRFLGEPSGIRTLDPLIKSAFERYFAGRAPDHSFALHLQYLPEIPEELPTPAPTWSVTHCAQR